MNIPREEHYMKIALSLAKRGRGKVSPNPLVGAVLVKNGQIIGKGFHQRAGRPHAEVNALKDAGNKAIGADLYINLEPCCHYGKTPPCTDALIAHRIRRVFVGMVDPNPLVSGKGIKRLVNAGIQVTTGILEGEARKLNEVFIKYTTEKMPFVIMKVASTLDGKIATRDGDARWITGEKARTFVHQLRNEVDAILVGIGTVKRDDPQLTTRLPHGRGRDPHRIILDTHLTIPLSSKLLHLDSQVRTIIATAAQHASSGKARKLEGLGATILTVPTLRGRINLKALLKKLGTRDITSVMVEGGRETITSFLEQGLVDKLYLFYAPKIIMGKEAVGITGGPGKALIQEAIRVNDVTVRRMGDDILIEGYLQK
jgi:diaminohydroxyphosphoribosylaminopyrimidine deaminase/5-amino-6-(5-phosphoribosylamino)uracil reductase